jgi:outer membrane receptor protein involved in Fe transport
MRQSSQHFGFGDGIRVRVHRDIAVKASYEWATRLPAVDELFGDGILIEPNLELAPERSHNVNLGARYEHGAFVGELNVFARLADKLIVLLGNDRYFMYQNVFAARITGIEGSGGWVAPGEWATLDASFTVQDIRNVSSEGTFGAFEGDRVPNRPWLLGSLGGSLRAHDLVRKGDELILFGSTRYVREFFRSWESAGLREFKQVVPSQLVHGAGVTYALRGAAPIATTIEVQNLSDARVYDSFGVQRPGRAIFVKLSTEL